MPRVPFLLDRDPYNAISVKVGGMLKEFAFTFKLLPGGEYQTEPSSPRTGVCRGTGSTCKEDPIVAKAVKMADRYHNPDPLI